MRRRNSVLQILAEAGVVNVQARSANQLAEERTDLATTRTLMAADRTLMAWTRTALSMISFGFTIYKLLEGFREAGVHLAHPHSPRTIGLFLTGMGTVSMVLGTIEYWRSIVSLREYHAVSICRPTFFVALVMAFSGSFLFLSIIIRLL
jgi:putative membrane protein